MEHCSARVPSDLDRPAEETLARWAWVEPSVWNARMLAALERGVQGGRWYRLMDKVYSWPNLQAAWARVYRNHGAAGVDWQSVELFAAHADQHLARLQQELREGRYEPYPVRRAWISKLGSKARRPLGIPAVRDRVVQGALRQVLEPIFEREFSCASYGFRPGRGCKDALRRVSSLLKTGYTWVVDADLEGYFDSIPHEALLSAVGEHVADGSVLSLLRQYLKAKVMEGLAEWEPERGTPQGAVISPLLGNVYLDALDHHLVAAGFHLIRYADDFVVLCRSQAEAERALAEIRSYTQALELRLHPEKTRLVDATQQGGFDFLGYHFERGYRWPRTKSVQKLKDTIRTKTRRTEGRSLEVIIQDVTATLRGWIGYFKHSHPTTFPELDSWVRMRLRSLLRKRHRGKGRGRGRDHQRWPNSYFIDRGLFTLVPAHRLACQSL